MPYPTTLNDIGKKYETDKSSNGHDYLTFYDERLSHLRNEKFTLYEIGVFKGGSLKTWCDYFPNATIVGMDITPTATQYAGGNGYIHIGDASRGDVIDEVVAKHGRPLIVVDDGSHIWHHQIEALRYFWPKILPGGVFIMEDIHTSFDGVTKEFPHMKGDSDISAYDYIMKLNRQVVGRGYMGDERPYDGFISNNWASVRSIEWYSRTAIIRKKE